MRPIPEPVPLATRWLAGRQLFACSKTRHTLAGMKLARAVSCRPRTASSGRRHIATCCAGWAFAVAVATVLALAVTAPSACLAAAAPASSAILAGDGVRLGWTTALGDSTHDVALDMVVVPPGVDTEPAYSAVATMYAPPCVALCAIAAARTHYTLCWLCWPQLRCWNVCSDRCGSSTAGP